MRDEGEVDAEFRCIAVSLALALLLAAASGHSPTATCTPAQASALSLSPKSVSPQGSKSSLAERQLSVSAVAPWFCVVCGEYQRKGQGQQPCYPRKDCRPEQSLGRGN